MIPAYKESTAHLILRAETAADLMTPNPLSVRDVATLREAVSFLIDKGFSAAPVIDTAGRPVGVLSQADIMIHDREEVEHISAVPEYYLKSELTARVGKANADSFQVEKVDRTLVRDIMTPVVFSVTPSASVSRVVHDLVSLKVHRLFVVDEAGVLVGVISALDVLRRLH